MDLHAVSRLVSGLSTVYQIKQVTFSIIRMTTLTIIKKTTHVPDANLNPASELITTSVMSRKLVERKTKVYTHVSRP